MLLAALSLAPQSTIIIVCTTMLATEPIQHIIMVNTRQCSECSRCGIKYLGWSVWCYQIKWECCLWL